MNNKMIIEERQADIGQFIVGRLLPFRKKRNVGPFVFIDHMGPTEINDGKYFDIDQHPHIGLCTLTYLYEGKVEHRDSTGSIQVVNPGDAGFMTAGKAVTHTERTPGDMRNGESFRMHGYQIWVALPKDKEEMDARFDYYPKETLPKWNQNGLTINLIAGEAFGKASPLQGYSSMFMVDVMAEETSDLNLKGQLEGELAIVIVQGKIIEEGNTIHAGQMLISKVNEACSIEIPKDTRLLLFGGQPFPEERFLMWNFASSSKERLNQAKHDWIDKKFPEVPGDETYIPFPNF